MQHWLALFLQGGCIHILIQYQHPEDNNQAWIPKIVVVFGLSLAILTVLMFPLVSRPGSWTWSAEGRIRLLAHSFSPAASLATGTSAQCPCQTRSGSCCHRLFAGHRQQSGM
jgi:hypothetical protein